MSIISETCQDIQVSIDLVAAAMRSEKGLFAGVPKPVIKEAERRYRQFLKLVKLYPREELAPARDIDEMWHLHMLHPVAYYNDCMANFGEILDHNGGFGTGSDEEAGELLLIFNKTAELWRQTFGEEYTSSQVHGDVTKCVRACRVACKKD